MPSLRTEIFELHCRQCNTLMAKMTMERSDDITGDRHARTIIRLNRAVRCHECFMESTEETEAHPDDNQRADQADHEHRVLYSEDTTPEQPGLPGVPARPSGEAYTRRQLISAAREWATRFGSPPQIEDWDVANFRNQNGGARGQARVDRWKTACESTGRDHWPGSRAVYAKWPHWGRFLAAARLIERSG